ncbi:MAG: ABC transporter substrate-binding protein [bacterium]|nr:ABC transporter substrate-binding protein [bacterium]
MLQHRSRLCSRLVLISSWCLISFLVGCHRQDERAEIRIGMVVELSLPEDRTYVEAAKLAVEEVNDAGGLDIGGDKHRVVLIVEDSQNTPEKVARATLKLVNRENVVALVGPNNSRNAIPASTVAENAHIPMIAPASSHPRTTAGKDYVFRVAYTDPFQGRVLARFALEELRTPRAAVLYDVADAYSRSLAAVFKEALEAAGGQVPAFESYTTGDQDFRPQLGRIARRKPGLLFLPNDDPDIITQAMQARQLGIDATLLGGDSWTSALTTYHPELEGAFTTQVWHVNATDAIPEGRAFVAAYRRACQQDPTSGPALTYDAVGLILQAIRNAGRAEPEAIRDALSQIENYRGAAGSITYRGMGGDPQRPALILQIKEGEIVLHKLVPPEPRR